MGTPALVLSQEYQFLLYTRHGEVPEGMLGWGGGTLLTTWEFKYCMIYEKMFYHVNTLLGFLIESCNGLMQTKDTPPTTHTHTHTHTHTQIQTLLALY